MVGRRRDQRLIDPARLSELEELAQDGWEFRRALGSLGPKRLRMMEAVREERADAEYARGWIGFESDLGDALLAITSERGAV
jgi:hypothetical protein